MCNEDFLMNYAGRPEITVTPSRQRCEPLRTWQESTVYSDKAVLMQLMKFSYTKTLHMLLQYGKVNTTTTRMIGPSIYYPVYPEGSAAQCQFTTPTDTSVVSYPLLPRNKYPDTTSAEETATNFRLVLTLRPPVFELRCEETAMSSVQHAGVSQ
ncbi:hypothetical protein HOLleu_31649 [Holothuria leucospilota]|uniref:Uncharacterized protein n=1 Tax=Holothuria leucospilota TaxID=206669 RepID=A0A9Q0YTB6_HOLLE|nr:hypothetical protein HOLleu_31649 [Holothuria leucospilota]